MKTVAFLGAALLATAAFGAQQIDLGTGSVVEAVQRLRAGEFVWAPQIAPSGPTLLLVNLKTQRAVLYRNGIPIGASTVSTGRSGYRTPTGVFTILQKRVEHYSSTYDNAPMPYMQRLTWRGISLHAGNLPGYPASHGCIRLPHGFAKLLYGATQLGMTVIITDQATTPRLAPSPQIAARFVQTQRPIGKVVWEPQLAPAGPVSIIVSARDGRAIVFRNGVEIGSGPVEVAGPISGTWAYALRKMDTSGQEWLRVRLSGDETGKENVPREEWRRFRAPSEFRRAIGSIVRPGTTIVVTSDSLKDGATGSVATIIDAEPPPNADPG